MRARLQVATIAVKSLDEAGRHFTEGLGLETVGAVQGSPHGFDLRWQRFGSGGVGFIDLIEPTSDSSVVAKFLAKRDEGLYLLQLVVPDLAEAIRELQARGTRLIGVDGRDPEDVDLFWIHPSAAHGALIEVAQDGGDAAEA